MEDIVRDFSRFADEYDRWFDAHSEVYAEQLNLLRRSIPADTGPMLEIGVGSGRFASRLGIRHGLDPSIRLLAMARDRGVEPVLGVGESLPYRDGTFDGVLMMTVICFMDDVARSFHESFRVLRPGGMLVVTFLEKDGEIARREEGSNGRFFRYARFFSVIEISALLASAGFSEGMVRERGKGLCVIRARKER